MDNKKLTANIVTNETVFNQTIEQAIDIEFTLPDFLPDINRILKCKAVTMISSKGINGNTINIDGCVTVTVIYLNEENNIFSYEYQYPYNKNIDTKQNCDNVVLNCKSVCEYINCRAVTKRKIDIHGAVEIFLKCISKKSVEVLSDFDSSDIEILRTEIPATTPMGHSEKNLILEDEIEIGQGQPDILSLVKYECCPVLKECRLMGGKAVIKGEMQISMLYTCEKGNLHTLKNTIPFSQILEIDGVTDECRCDTKIVVAFLEIKPQTQSNGECRAFSFNCKLLITSDAYCENYVEIISDCFSKKYLSEVIKKNMFIEKLKNCISEEFSCKKNIEIENESISSVIDLWSEIQSVKYSFFDNHLVVTGIITVGIIALNEEMIPSYYEKGIEFEYKTQLDKKCDNLWCEPIIKILSTNYTLTVDGIELRLELSVNSCIYSKENVSYVSDLKIENTLINNSNIEAMIIYFAMSGENIWEIAKKYSAGVEEIKKLNSINEDVLLVEKALLIPIS